MSLTKAPRKTMRTHYLKPPTKGSTTAYICHQAYDQVAKRTVQTLVASFNIAADPATPVVSVTVKGRALGYTEVPAEHLVEVQKWLKKNGTRDKVKVPASVLARVRAEVEAQVRDELGAPVTVPAPVAKPVPAPRPKTLSDKLSAMLRAIEEVKNALAATPVDQALEVSKAAGSDWRMCSFAFSEVLELAGESKRGMGRPKGWQSKDWAGEAIQREYYTREKLDASLKAAAKAKAKRDAGGSPAAD